MKLFNKTKFIKFVAFLALVGMSMTGSSYAAPEDLVVDFENTPLFSEANFLPGNTVTRTVGVTNNTDSTKDIIVESINVTDPDDFAGALNMVITEGEDELYNNTLADFFGAGEVNLSSVAGSGESTIYNFTISFVSGFGNSYQENDLGFDIVIGFAGEEGGGGDEGEGGGGGGGGGSPAGLSIVDETVEVLDVGTTSVTIVWNTSYRSTSRVVYGTTPGLFNFNLSPNYGYPFSTAELGAPAASNGVFNHSVTISGLTPGTTYYFRSISHASPDSISFEHSFTTAGSSGTSAPTQPGVNSGSIAGTGDINSFLSGGNSSGGEFSDDQLTLSGQDRKDQISSSPSAFSETSEENQQTSGTNNFLASIGNLLDSVILWWLVVLAIAVILTPVLRRKMNRKN